MFLASYWEFRSFKAARLPSLTLKTTPIQYNRDIVRRYDSDLDQDVYREQQSVYSYGNLSINQNVDLTGGTFFVDSELGYIRNFGNRKHTQYTSVPIRIGYSQSLFGFNSFKWEKKMEPVKFEKAQKQFIYNQEEIAGTTVSYFFNLAMAQKEYDLANENVLSTDTLYNIGQERHKIASISQADLLTLKLDAVNARNNLKNKEISLKRTQFSLLSFLNMSENSEIELILPEHVSQMYISPIKAVEHAQENNPDYIAYTQELLAAKRDVEQTKRNSVFNANISASVGFNQVADNFSDAYRSPMRQDIIRVGLTIPILDWGVRKGKVNMAQNNLNVTLISIQQKKQALEQEIIMSVSDFNIQKDLVSSAEEAMGLADMAYNMTKQRFIIGKADINSLTLSFERKNNAQKGYIQALHNYWVSYYKIRKLTSYDFENNKSLFVEFDEKMNKR